MNKLLFLLLALVPLMLALTLSNNMTHTSAATPIANMTQYKDPQGRFSISYPSNWTVTPATNRFQVVVVQFADPTGANLNIGTPSFTTNTDPEVEINQAVNSLGYGESLFQNTECTKYKVDGQRACDYIETRDANSVTGTNPALVQMQLASYVNGKLYLFTSTADQDIFDSHLPTFEKMMASFRSPP